jgi:hypothetical protein
VGNGLLQHFNGQAADLVTAAGQSAVALVQLLTSHFPGFRDHSIYKGRQVRKVLGFNTSFMLQRIVDAQRRAARAICPVSCRLCTKSAWCTAVDCRHSLHYTGCALKCSVCVVARTPHGVVSHFICLTLGNSLCIAAGVLLQACADLCG